MLSNTFIHQIVSLDQRVQQSHIFCCINSGLLKYWFNFGFWHCRCSLLDLIANIMEMLIGDWFVITWTQLLWNQDTTHKKRFKPYDLKIWINRLINHFLWVVVPSGLPRFLNQKLNFDQFFILQIVWNRHSFIKRILIPKVLLKIRIVTNSDILF